MRKKLTFTVALLLSLSLVCSCGAGNNSGQPPLASNSVIVADDSIPEGISPNITGVITSISEVRDGIMALVEIPDAQNTYTDNRYYVTITGKTVLQDKDKNPCQSYRELSAGDTVSVWFTGSSTGTTPEYAVAQGVRITSKVEDMLLTLKLAGNVIMASPTAGEVTSTDIKPLLYGSYLITDISSNGIISLYFARTPVSVTASAVSSENGETVYLTGDVSELELPGTLKEGEYTVTVKAESEDSADYYIFVLGVR